MVVDDFYATIDEHPEARHVITGGTSQIERLKKSLKLWLESLLSGTYDEEYLARHARIGRVHVRIGLPQHLMFTAMSRVREKLTQAADSVLAGDTTRRGLVVAALNRLLDIELAIMLDSYREDLSEKQRAHERLATIGELAASVGHELRNPLGTMESSLYLMKRRMEAMAIDDAQLTKHHEKASRQVEHCTDTISRLLDLARDRPPRFEWVPLADLVRRTVSNMSLASATRVSVEIADSLSVWADATQLGLVVMNLIRNAGEAAPEGVSVLVRATAEQGGVAITFHDDGPGIEAEARSRIFEALFTTRSQGTGLGLALVARILDAHSGEIGLLDVPRGAAFRIWLPDAPRPGG
jgi:signal transduction histidine kinase